MVKYALSVALLAVALLHQASATSKKVSKDEGRLLFSAGADNSVTFNGEMIFATIVFFFLGAIAAFFIYFYAGWDSHYYRYGDYQYQAPTSYGHSSYSVHRSLDEAAKKYEDNAAYRK